MSRVEHQTPEIKINKNQNFNIASEDDIKLYFRSQFTNNYKVEEKEFKKIIDKDVQNHDKDKHVKLLTYYKNTKVKKMFIAKNNTNNKTSNLSENNNVIYKYTCDKACDTYTYILLCLSCNNYSNGKNKTLFFYLITLLFESLVVISI